MVKPAPTAPCLLFSRADVERLLDPESAIAAVEAGFRRLGAGLRPSGGVLGLHLPGGGFHVKAAVFPAGAADRTYLAAKLNANFPGNPAATGLPTIQGIVGLFDAENGAPLAVMDSAAITRLRTAAATAVAATYLAAEGAGTLTIIGCGAQAGAQVAALGRVRRLTRVWTADRDRGVAARFAADLAGRLGIPVEAALDLRAAVRGSDLVITCTPSTRALLGPGDVRAGTFVAAVGADSEGKSEIDPRVLAGATVVTDDRHQCAAIGDLHHAIARGAMTIGDVHADLAEVVAGTVVGRRAADDTVIFDSTGLPFQDVVAAALVYERGRERGVGLAFGFRE